MNPESYVDDVKKQVCAEGQWPQEGRHTLYSGLSMRGAVHLPL